MAFKTKMKTKKQQIKQKIAATTIVIFMVAMVFGSQNEFASAIGTNTILIQNFIAGQLQLETLTTLGFNDLTVGTAASSLANLSIVNIRDYRGTGAGWTVTGVVNNMFTSAAGTYNYINNAVIAWAPGTIFALDGGASTNNVTSGSPGYFSTSQTLAAATVNNGFGNYKLTNTILNIVYNGNAGQKVGTYQGTLLMTIN